jgi:hypothetical protein
VAQDDVEEDEVAEGHAGAPPVEGAERVRDGASRRAGHFEEDLGRLGAGDGAAPPEAAEELVHLEQGREARGGLPATSAASRASTVRRFVAEEAQEPRQPGQRGGGFGERTGA